MFKKVVIFHHHLLPGGVTQVISQSIAAIMRYLPEIEEILVVSGREENSENAVQPVQVVVAPEIDYITEKNAGEEVYQTIFKKLERFAGDALWWIHNYHLGKNPLFTRALLDYAHSYENQHMLFHIHDFPECSRFDNLSFLLNNCPLPIYPNLPNVRYGVINSRDRDILIRSGLPQDKVFLLHDPVPPAKPVSPAPEEARRLMERYGREQGDRYNSGGKLLFYPVRTIRRKNVLEAVLTTLLMKEEVNLIVTLPGVSSSERGYSSLIRSCFDRGLVPGLFGTGRTPGAPGFGTITAASHLVLSSSVQEGFGYLFLNAIQWERPLAAHYLEILEGIDQVFSGYPHLFYDALRVPISPAAGAALQERYRNRIDHIRNLLPRKLQPEIGGELLNEVEKLVDGNLVDFSYLSPADQEEIVKQTADSGYRKETQTLNGDVIEGMESLLSRECSLSDEIEKQFGLEAFSSTFRAICTSFFAEDGNSGGQPGDQGAVLRAFTSLENIRLLYE